MEKHDDILNYYMIKNKNDLDFINNLIKPFYVKCYPSIIAPCVYDDILDQYSCYIKLIGFNARSNINLPEFNGKPYFTLEEGSFIYQKNSNPKIIIEKIETYIENVYSKKSLVEKLINSAFMAKASIDSVPEQLNYIMSNLAGTPLENELAKKITKAIICNGHTKVYADEIYMTLFMYSIDLIKKSNEEKEIKKLT